MARYPEPQVGDLWQYRDGAHYHFLVTDKYYNTDVPPEQYYCETDLYCLETGMPAKHYLFPKYNVYWKKLS